MTELLNTKHATIQEKKHILNIARHNGFPKQYISNMIKKQLTKNKQVLNRTNDVQAEQAKKKWITFTYHSPLIVK